MSVSDTSPARWSPMGRWVTDSNGNFIHINAWVEQTTNTAYIINSFYSSRLPLFHKIYSIQCLGLHIAATYTQK